MHNIKVILFTILGILACIGIGTLYVLWPMFSTLVKGIH